LSDGSVVVVEIKGGAVTRVGPDGSVDVVARTGGGPNGAALGPDGKLYVANNGGSFDWVTRSRLEVVAAVDVDAILAQPHAPHILTTAAASAVEASLALV
jgi:gluconolactonase